MNVDFVAPYWLVVVIVAILFLWHRWWFTYRCENKRTLTDCPWPQSATKESQDNSFRRDNVKTRKVPSMPHSVLFEALWKPVEYLLRDFVLHWYNASIGGSSDFPNDIRELAHNVVSSLCERLLRVDWATVIRHNGLRSLQDMIRVYRICERDLYKRNSFTRKLPLDKRNSLLLAELVRTHCLHNGVSEPLSYARNVAAMLVSELMPPKDLQCSVISSLLREILTHNVLVPAMRFTEPYYINCMIISLLTSVTKPSSNSSDHEVDSDVTQDISSNTNTMISCECDNSPLSTEGDESFVNIRMMERCSEIQCHHHHQHHHCHHHHHHRRRRRRVGPPQTQWNVQIVKVIVRWDPRPYVVYLLEVSFHSAKWLVAKRFSDFIELHSQFKKNIPGFRCKLPKKSLFSNFKREFIQQRRMDLHRYLQNIEFNRRCLNSDIWTCFLAPNHVLSIPSQKLSSQSMSSSASNSPCNRTTECYRTNSAEHVDEIINDVNNKHSLRTESRDFAQELYDLVQEVFELDKGGMRTWISSLLIDTIITRQVRDTFPNISQEVVLASIINIISNRLSPTESLAQPSTISDEEISRCCVQAERMLIHSTPFVLSRFLGRDFTHKGLSKLFSFLQVKSLVCHFVLTLLDAILKQMFPFAHKQSHFHTEKNT